MLHNHIDSASSFPFRDTDRPGHEECTGCGICTLPCPVWHQTRDIMLTCYGRARALQGGASLEELRRSLMACVLCGACEAVCPVGIDSVGMTIDLRAILAKKGISPLTELPALRESKSTGAETRPAGQGPALFLPNVTLRANGMVKRIQRLLGNNGIVQTAADDGSDIAAALEAGLEPAAERMERFIRSLAGAKELIVTQGLLHRSLRKWLPGVRVSGLGESLLRRDIIRNNLRPTDLLVIETRGFHADHDRLVQEYDALRREVGCVMNLDLQRIAIPTGAVSLQNGLHMNIVDAYEQVRLILDGHRIDRIVAECPEDPVLFKKVTRLRVIHISELAPAEEDI